jgi:hypothetical protein
MCTQEGSFVIGFICYLIPFFFRNEDFPLRNYLESNLGQSQFDVHWLHMRFCQRKSGVIGKEYSLPSDKVHYEPGVNAETRML